MSDSHYLHLFEWQGAYDAFARDGRLVFCWDPFADDADESEEHFLKGIEVPIDGTWLHTFADYGFEGAGYVARHLLYEASTRYPGSDCATVGGALSPLIDRKIRVCDLSFATGEFSNALSPERAETIVRTISEVNIQDSSERAATMIPIIAPENAYFRQPSDILVYLDLLCQLTQRAARERLGILSVYV